MRGSDVARSSLTEALMPNLDTAVVIPVYNEGPVIGQVLASVLAEYEQVICVDDGSTDDSAEQITASGALLVQHPVNLGQGAALQTGIEFALLDPRVQYLVTYDADGQHQLSDVRRMLEVAREREVDVVFGSRFLDDRTDVGKLKRAVLKTAVAYTNATSGVRLTDAHNGLRVMNRKAASAMRIRQSGMAHASEIVETVRRDGLTFTEVPVHILYTEYSRSKGQSLLNAVNILFDLIFR